MEKEKKENKLARWLRINVQHKVTVLDILKYGLNHKKPGLCWTLDDACRHYMVRPYDFKYKCAKFRAAEAEKFGANPSQGWWWPKGTWKGRELFLKYLIEHYSKLPPIYVDRINTT